MRDLVAVWVKESGDRLENSGYARTVLERALTSLVPDDAPAAVVVDDDAMPVVAAVVEGRLLLFQASAPGQAEDPVAECRTLVLNDRTKISVIHRAVQAGFGLETRRRWTVSDANGEQVSFDTGVLPRNLGLKPRSCAHWLKPSAGGCPAPRATVRARDLVRSAD